MSKYALSDEMRLDMVRLFYAHGSSWTATRREQLKKNIRREAKKLKIDMVKSAIDNMLPRVQNLLCRKGAWFEKLLKY